MEIRIIAAKKGKRSAKRKKNQKTRPQWSKVLTVLVLIPYIAVILLSFYITVRLLSAGESEYLVDLVKALLAFVTAPLAVAYGFYFWKSKAENLVKLAKDLKRSGISDDVAEEIVKTDEIIGG